ncbi:aminotransferase-like domain-containing protein [Nonomuraea rhodomycinica]|uniref:PLP-dependent aminotransferase family protein n=1 Tax=Nonomuraea rhodomycinica TaxID=1712872 RepID=A0A7Y6ME69_9ACTN|nr:PLP-dependent aminotransferase family protein [Nonomuraea rhodomycinica]NUW43384.1 PLP-dependent aminotransferase family protein [Nonomuraea rhodomycinica]
MDHDLGWWVRIALDGWRRRSGPHYRRIAEGIADAMERRLVAAEERLPAERTLADALGVSRGTLVRAYGELADAGWVERRQGAGTFVRPRPLSAHAPVESAASALLRRRLAQDGSAGSKEIIDLSLSVPAGVDHLPPFDGGIPPRELRGHGLHPAGLPALRAALATHLTARLRLPTTPDQLIVTSGARHALSLVLAALDSPARSVITGCPTHPGLASAVRGERPIAVPVDAFGIDAQAVRRLAVRTPVVYVDSAAHDPTGAVLSASRRDSLLALVRRGGALLVEDLAQAGLDLEREGQPVIPLAARDDSVIALGSLSKMFWAGLRVGWIRAPEWLRDVLLLLASASDLAPGVPAQLIAARLLGAAGATWQDELRRSLRDRRDLLLGLLRRQLPAWRPEVPRAGLSAWVSLPVTESETFAHLAARYGVIVAPGAAACVDGRHHHGVRLSFAESPRTLESAVDRLVAAWEEHSRRLAVGR